MMKPLFLGAAFSVILAVFAPTSFVQASENEQDNFEVYEEDASLEIDNKENANNIGDGFEVYTAVESAQEESVVQTLALGAGTTVYKGENYALVYDYDYYSSHNSDLQKIFGTDEEKYLSHFVVSGMKEGRQGKESFDVLAYAAANPDLRNAFGNTLSSYYKHYINNGAAEGRVAVGSHSITNYVKSVSGYDLSGIYDYNYYVSKYEDVRRAFGLNDKAAFDHFLNYGLKEGRIAKADSDISIYNKFKPLGANLAKIRTNLWNIEFSPVYDYVYYMTNNPDVAKAVNYDSYSALRHFADYGIFEGRKGKETYNEIVYNNLKAQYEPNRFKNDFAKAKAVLDAVGWDLKAAFNWSAGMPYYGRNGLLPVVPDNGIDWFANFGFDNYKGNCYVAAGTFYEMATLLGYSPRQMAGMVPSRKGPLTPHSWVEIDMDGKTYVFDPNFDNGQRSGFKIWYGKSGTWRYTQYSPMHL